jgi:GTP-binding protein HflX
VLTNSRVSVKDRPFETLDTSSRRLRFPAEREVILTDTVGFMRDLPKELTGAFRSTLEELRDADLLLHVVDASAKDPEEQISAVEGILADLNLDRIPCMLVFNKCDRVSPAEAAILCRRFGAVAVSSFQPDTLRPLVRSLEQRLAELHGPWARWETAPHMPEMPLTAHKA